MFLSWLEFETEVPASTFFTDFVQEPCNGLLLHKSCAVEMFADSRSELALSYTVLADDMVQSSPSIVWAGSLRERVLGGSAYAIGAAAIMV